MMELDVTKLKGAKIGDSAFLHETEYKAFNEAIFETKITPNRLSNVFPLKRINQWKTHYEYTKLDKYGNATESEMPGDADAEEVSGTTVTVRVPFYHNDFTFTEFDKRNMRDIGQIDTVKARAAAERINTLMDEALWNRSSIYGTLGAYGLFTGTGSGAAVWSGANAEAIYNDVVDFVHALPEEYAEGAPLVMVLNRTNLGEMMKVNANNLSAFEKVKNTFPQLRVVSSKQVTEGTGLLFPSTEEVCHLVTGWPLSTIEMEANPLQARFKVLTSTRLVVVRPSAGLKLSV